jgi:hypothetical protein
VTTKPGPTNWSSSTYLAKGDLRGDPRVERPVDGDHETGPDELVELDVVNGPAPPPLGGVEDEEHVVRVGVDLRDLAALLAVSHGQRMEPEHLGEHPDALGVAGGDVHPHEPLSHGDQQVELLDRLPLDPAVGDQPDVHDPPPPVPCCTADPSLRLRW